MKDIDRRVMALAEQQHGAVSREQLRALGLSSSNLSYRLRQGRMIEFGTSTFRMPGTTPTWYGVLTAGLLDLGPEALITGRAAARLLGLDGFESESAEFLVPRALRHRTTIGTVTSSADIRSCDRTRVDGFPITSATRTIIELFRTATLEESGNALDSACRQRLTAIPVVRRRLEDLGRSGRTGVAAFDELLRVGTVESWLERRFVKVIRDARLPEPVLQQRHRLDDVGIARVDFEYSLWGVVVEVGGQRGYLSLDERRRQERRRNALQLEGRTIYFFTRTDIVDEPGYVVRTIAAALGTTNVAGDPA